MYLIIPIVSIGQNPATTNIQVVTYIQGKEDHGRKVPTFRNLLTYIHLEILHV